MQETQETRVQSLGWEDALEKEMATDSSILAWEIPWTEEPGGLRSMGPQKSWTHLSMQAYTHAHADTVPKLPLGLDTVSYSPA